jgi:hypothetical protein
MPLLRCSITILFFCAGCFAAELTGTVTSKSGQPISGASIYSPVGVRYDHNTETDSQGKFKLPDHSRVVFFRHGNFRPLSKIVDLATTNLDVVLEESTGSELKVSVCPTTSEFGERVGFEMKFLITGEMAVTVVNGAHGRIFHIFDKKDEHVPLKERELMVLEGGYSEFYPEEELLLSASGYAERWWMFGLEKGGVDIQGRGKNGSWWRWTGLLKNPITYRNVSERKAKAFDKIIDSMCLDPEILERLKRV